MQAVVFWGAIKLASVPEIGAGGEGSPRGVNGLGGRDGVWAPGEACTESVKFS